MARETKDIYELGEIPPEFHVPKMMHAWAIRRERHGRPSTAMQLEQVPVPEIDSDEVLVLVMAAGVNYNGIWAGLGRRARENGSRPLRPARASRFRHSIFTSRIITSQAQTPRGLSGRSAAR